MVLSLEMCNARAMEVAVACWPFILLCPYEMEARARLGPKGGALSLTSTNFCSRCGLKLNGLPLKSHSCYRQSEVYQDNAEVPRVATLSAADNTRLLETKSAHPSQNALILNSPSVRTHLEHRNRTPVIDLEIEDPESDRFSLCHTGLDELPMQLPRKRSRSPSPVSSSKRVRRDNSAATNALSAPSLLEAHDTLMFEDLKEFGASSLIRILCNFQHSLW